MAFGVLARGSGVFSLVVGFNPLLLLSGVCFLVMDWLLGGALLMFFLPFSFGGVS